MLHLNNCPVLLIYCYLLFIYCFFCAYCIFVQPYSQFSQQIYKATSICVSKLDRLWRRYGLFLAVISSLSDWGRSSFFYIIYLTHIIPDKAPCHFPYIAPHFPCHAHISFHHAAAWQKYFSFYDISYIINIERFMILDGSRHI